MIDIKEVKHIAELARIKFSEKELKDLQKNLSSILDYFHKLKEVNVDDIELSNNLSIDRKTTREDEPSQDNPEMSEKLVELAFERKKRFIKVKSVFN
ncbi:MAG: Asp-tRNA(Asn)/Glu-tRNA(Gln) amidotransferase subunit GatC [Patescibacteria group bacterium]|nr:Asp-tRNA(Asn)/Glu-tRNA(Gln) amidotransferase subunit GatC [Patescibacteria group bacterium]